MSPSLYWLEQSFTALPLFALVYFGMGIPPALLLLPRRDWRQAPVLLCLAFVCGPALLTLWMFILGTMGGAQNTPLLTPGWILAGCVVITLLSAVLAWQKFRRTKAPEPAPFLPLAFDEKLILGILALAVIIRWITTAYWTFTAYDTLWVYGFQGRLYALNGYIPADIGYYPQFLSLQYAFAQIFTGTMDDHAARMAIPFLHLGSLLAAYVLGARLFNRRTGIALVAIWGLYPHVSAWAHQGDLEIPLAFLFTSAAAFFLMAWTAQPGEPRRHYAVIAGVILGVALWTKPTAGAFIWGVVLLVAVEFFRLIRRAKFEDFTGRFETAAITGLACLPVGAMWYVRNILLGHRPVDFPHSSWLSRATRSGDLFGWLLLALVLLLVYLALECIRNSGKKHNAETQRDRETAKDTGRNDDLTPQPPLQTERGGKTPLPEFGEGQGVGLALLFLGLLLLFAGAMPSMPWVAPARIDPPASYITVPEAMLLAAGVAVVAFAFYRLAAGYRTAETEIGTSRITGAMLLALPYFITWFYSYSYHYRLSFAIVPLLMLPSAVILSHLTGRLVHSGRGLNLSTQHSALSTFKYVIYAILLIAISLPGLAASITEAAREKDWLWTDRYPDDTARYRESNPDMILVRDTLQGYMNTTQKEPVVIAPGEQRLHFFFPQMTIITDTVPTRLDELEGATHFIYGSQASWRYEDENIPPETSQILAAAGRSDVLREALFFNEGIFRYEVYEVHLENRWRQSEFVIPFDDEIVYDDAVRLAGYSLNNTNLAGNKIFIALQFDALVQPDKDYIVQLHMVNLNDGQVYHTADTCVMPGRHGCYISTMWDKGESVFHESVLVQEADGAKFIRGDYALVIGLYTLDENGQPDYAPVTVNGEAVPDFRLEGFTTG